MGEGSDRPGAQGPLDGELIASIEEALSAGWDEHHAETFPIVVKIMMNEAVAEELMEGWMHVQDHNCQAGAVLMGILATAVMSGVADVQLAKDKGDTTPETGTVVFDIGIQHEDDEITIDLSPEIAAAHSDEDEGPEELAA